MKDLRRFQSEKEDDLRRYMVCFLPIELIVSMLTDPQMEFAQCHIDWAKRNKAAWEEAKAEVENIAPQPSEEYPRRAEDFEAREQ